jgi:hypothetical protein
VPKGHTEGSFRLGAWASNQRGKKDGMAAERRQRLDELGFEWASPRSGHK